MLATLIRQTVTPLLPTWSRPSSKRAFDRKVLVDFTVRDYRVKTVDSLEEFRQVLALRRNVFHYEFARKWLSLRSDKDMFDEGADHLAIFDQKQGRLAGVYRVIPSHVERPFYSATEFDISKFLLIPGRKMELSRACIDRDYRNGIVISLLWKGIAEYAKAAGMDYLFGLSSVTTTDLPEVAAIHAHFESTGILDLSHGIAAKDPYRIGGFDQLPHGDATAGAALVPSLFKTYLKAGAKVCSQPVIDRAFQCADWLTVLDMRRLTGSFDRRFMRD